MTIQQMQYALEIYRSNSISKAAVRLFMTQSNLSTVLLRMEKELGFPIFTRSSKGISPTENGMRFLRYASTICANYEEMTAGLNTSTLRVRISGAHYSPLKEAFRKLVVECDGSESLHFSYTVPGQQEALEQLSTGSLDLTVLLTDSANLPNLRRQAKEMRLSITPRNMIPIVLRIGPKHPLYNEPEIRLTDFQNYTFVDYPRNPFLRNKDIAKLFPFNENRIVSVNDPQLRNQLVASGSMYSIGTKLPDHMNKQYHFRSIPLGNLSHQIISLVQEGRTPSKEVTRYLELLDEELAAL